MTTFSLFSTSPTTTNDWSPISSYCHGIGRSALEALRTLKSTIFSADQFIGGSSRISSLLLQKDGPRIDDDRLGWIVQTRVHFGNRLTRYVGISVFVKCQATKWNLIARATGIILLMGVGSYVAYRLCLKIFGYRDLTSLLRACLHKKNDPEEQEESERKRCLRRCGICKRSYVRTGGDNEDVEPIGSEATCEYCSTRKVGEGDDDVRMKSRRRRKQGGRQRGVHSQANDNEQLLRGESSSGTSELETSEELEDENPTEMTDLASECSGDGGMLTMDAEIGIEAHLSNSDNPQPSTSSRESPQRIRRWRASARKRTNALDDPNNLNSPSDDEQDEDGDEGFSKSRSPPPIPRFRLDTGTSSAAAAMSQSMPAPATSSSAKRAPSIRSSSVRSVPSSSQQFIWDPICTPNDEQSPLNDDLLAYFADVPTGELVQRFLDGLFLSSDQNRAVSPGPSEAASEYSLSGIRQIGDCAAENFDRIHLDLCELQTDVTDFDAELTTYLQERNDCLNSDSRQFYRSVIVDENDEESSSTTAAANEDQEAEDATPPATPPRAKSSPCHRFGSNKRQRRSHESTTSNGSSSEKVEAKESTKKNKRKRRKGEAVAGDLSAQNEQRGDRGEKESVDDNDRELEPADDDEDGRNIIDDRQTELPKDDDRRTPVSCNEKSMISLDAGYSSSSYHAMMSSADSGDSAEIAAEMVTIDCSDDRSAMSISKRPTNLPLPSIVYEHHHDDTDNQESSKEMISDESGKPPSSFYDSLPASSSSAVSSPYGITPEEQHWLKRPASAISMEWEDEISFHGGFDDGASPSSSARSAGADVGRKTKTVDGCDKKSRLKAMDLMEYLRIYYRVEDLQEVPKVFKIGRKLTKRGYRRVLLYNDRGRIDNNDTASSSSSQSSQLDNLITASLMGIAHFRWPIFKCQSFRIVPEAVDVSMKRCSFFAERCSTYFGCSTTPEATRAYILRCMQKLWQLHETVQQDELRSKSTRSLHQEPTSPSSSSTSPWTLLDGCMKELIDAMKVLMALRSLETYEEILFTRKTPSPFFTDLFRIYTPSAYAEKKLFRLDSSTSASDLDDLDIALLADTLGVRIEMFRPNSSHPESVAVYPELEHNVNVSSPRLPLLEPTVGHGLYLPLI